MVRYVILLILVSVPSFQLVSSATILDLLWTSDSLTPIESREDNVESDNQKSCSCIKSSCKCCVDFNITYIDLGGPGCVEMDYISQEEGLSVNVSYGENLLHSEEVKGPNPKPTCISLLGSFAEVCARFSTLEPNNDGLKGCLVLEPKLLGDVQTEFDIGCFLMGPDGMQLDPNSNSTFNQLIENNSAEVHNSTEPFDCSSRPISFPSIKSDQLYLVPVHKNETEASGFNEEELIAAVNESAKQGLLFFGNLFGLAFDNSDVNNTDVTNSQINATTQSDTSRKLSTKLNLI